MPKPRPPIEQAFAKGRLEIDFPAGEFDSAGRVILRATQVFLSNLPFLAGVTLLVHLPSKLLVQLLCYAFDLPLEGIAAYLLMDICDLVASSLVIPSIFYGLMARFRDGKASSLSDSLRWGRRQWGRTLWNKFKVEITIAVWSLLLVVPGIVAMMKLIFTDAVVAIDADGESEPLARSRDLSDGRRWRILAALLPALPLGVAHMYATLRTVQVAPLGLAPVDSLFAILDQWMNVTILLIYLALSVKRKPA